jgi:hypothetical protein
MPVSIVKKHVLYQLYDWDYVLITDDTPIQPEWQICDADKANHINVMLFQIDTFSNTTVGKPITALFPINCHETMTIIDFNPYKGNELYIMAEITSLDIHISFPGNPITCHN